MKKLIVILALAALAAGSAAAQDKVMTGAEDLNLDIQIKHSPASFSLLDYFYIGAIGTVGEEYDPDAKFISNREFGFNIMNLGLRLSDNDRFTLGADVHWTRYRLSAENIWQPYNVASLIAEENGTRVAIVNKTIAGISSVDKSVLKVTTFEFPLNYAHSFGKLNVSIGAALDLNLHAKSVFKGKSLSGDSINEKKSGRRYSSSIVTNDLGYNFHASVSYSGLGLYFKYYPTPMLKETYGPQFQTWSVGLILGI